MKFSNVNIRPGLEFQIHGWDNVLGECYDSNVTVADVNALDFSECKVLFDPLVLDININNCAKTKNNGKISMVIILLLLIISMVKK